MNTKIAVSVPEDLVETAHQAVASGRANSISAYVAAALDHYRRQQTLAEFLADWEAELGPIPEHVKAEAEADIARVAGTVPVADPQRAYFLESFEFDDRSAAWR
ncbi:MAG: hypothetical protein ACRDPW_01235 [Mycobacteriales bacterium]